VRTCCESLEAKVVLLAARMRDIIKGAFTRAVIPVRATTLVSFHSIIGYLQHLLLA
jgi:hypothetical protein